MKQSTLTTLTILRPFIHKKLTEFYPVDRELGNGFKTDYRWAWEEDQDLKLWKKSKGRPRFGQGDAWTLQQIDGGKHAFHHGCDVIYQEGENYAEADVAKYQASEDRRRQFLLNPLNNRRVRVRQQFGEGLELPRDPPQDAVRRSEQDRTQGNMHNHPTHPPPLIQNHPRPLMQINFPQIHHRPIRPSGMITPSRQLTPVIQQPFPTYSSAQAPRMYPRAQRDTTHPSQTVQRRMTPSENEDRRGYMGQQSDTDDIQSQAVTQSNDRPPSYHQATGQPRTPLDVAAGTFADEMMDTSSTGYRTMTGPQVAPVTAGAHLPQPYPAHQSAHLSSVGDHERERARENDRREDERIRRREEEDRRERERRRRDEEDRRSRREQYSSQRNTIPRPSHLMGANRKTAENTYDKVFKSKPGPKIQKAAYMLDVNKMKKNLLTQVLRLNIYSEEVKRKEGSNNLVNCWIAELNPGLFLIMKEKFLNRVYDEEFRVSGHRFILRRYEDKGAADGTVDTCRMRIIKVSSLETAYFHVYLTKAKVI